MCVWASERRWNTLPSIDPRPRDSASLPCGVGSLICIRPHRLAAAGKLDPPDDAEKPSHLAFRPNWWASECHFLSFASWLDVWARGHGLQFSQMGFCKCSRISESFIWLRKNVTGYGCTVITLQCVIDTWNPRVPHLKCLCHKTMCESISYSL